MTLTKTTIESETNAARAVSHTLDIVCGAVRDVWTLDNPMTMEEVYHVLSVGGVRPISVTHYKGTTTVTLREGD